MAATDRYKSLHELNPAQAIAVDALDSGSSHLEAAKAAGVDRTTVSRWATKHPAFIAELNRRKQERAADHTYKIASVTRAALGLIESSIQDGDTRTALEFLKRFGLDSITAPVGGPTSSDGVIDWYRRSLPPVNGGPLEQLDVLDGKTRERALDDIIEALGDSGL